MTKLAQDHVKERKEKIRIIAEEVFAQYTFPGATIRLITQRSGINASMISYYFGSKEALYLYIFQKRMEEISAAINRFEKLDLDPPGKLMAYVKAYTGRVMHNRNFYRLLCNELVSVQHPAVILIVSEARQQVHDFLLKTITQGISQGYLKQTDEAVLVLNILALVWSAFVDDMSVHIHLPGQSRKALRQRILQYITTMLNPEDHHSLKNTSHV